MDWSTRKKFGCISIVVAIVLVVIGYYTYKIFFTHVPTCFDGIQNQDEQATDCNGVCARVCPFSARTIVPLWTRAFNIQQGVNSVVAYIENQNANAGIKKIKYEFRIYDDQNILAGNPISGTTFVGPNQRTVIFESPVDTGSRVPKNVFFKFTEEPEWTRTDPKYSLPQLGTANTSLTDIETVPKLSADIVNKTLFDYKNIQVIAILYGADGNAINASSTFVESIPEQSTQKVYFTWPQKFSAPVTRIEIIPRLNPFIQEN